VPKTVVLEPREYDMPDSATELLQRPLEEIAETEVTGAEPEEVVAADLLVEEISIDGMCGVY
jgi:mycofactocin precursor